MMKYQLLYDAFVSSRFWYGGVKYGVWSKSMSHGGEGAEDGALWLVVGVQDLTHNYIVCPVTCEG